MEELDNKEELNTQDVPPMDVDNMGGETDIENPMDGSADDGSSIEYMELDHNSNVGARNSQDNGLTLLKQAIKMYEDGNIETADNLRKLANEYLDGKKETTPIDTDDLDDDLLYGESRNFGVIYHILEANSANLYKTKEGRKVLKEAVKCIRGSVVLSEEFNYYNLFDTTEKIDSPISYVNEVCNLKPTLSINLIREHNQKLLDILRKGNVNEIIDISDKDMAVYEAIENTIVIKPTNTKAILKLSESKRILAESLSAPKKEVENKITMSDYKNMVSETVEKLTSNLTDDEFNLIKEMTNPSCNTEETFNKYKQSTLKKLSRAMNETTNKETKSKLSEIYIDLNEQTYKKETALLDVAKFIEIENIL